MSYDPIPASGAGAELFDQPALFYLTNQRLIEEWHALRSNVADTVSEWLRTTVRESLAAAAQERHLEISVARGPGSYHHVVLHPPETPVLGTKPVIGVGYGWPSRTVIPSSAAVFACVRCSRNQTGKNAAAAFVGAGGRAARAVLGARGSDNSAWPIELPIPGEANWWTDLDAYRKVVVDKTLRVVDEVRDALLVAAQVPVVGPEDETE